MVAKSAIERVYTSEMATRLSYREHEIILAVAREGGRREAARTLGVAEETVRNTLSNVYRKLGVSGLPQTLYLLHIAHRF